MVMLLTTGVWLSRSGSVALSHLDVRRKPSWWLLADAEGRDTAKTSAAVDELITRWKLGALSAAHTKRLIDVLLDVHADLRNAWIPGTWDALIISAQASGNLSQQKWRRYWGDAWEFQLATRRQVRRGDPLPLDLVLQDRFPRRFADGSVHLKYHLGGLAIDGRPLKAPDIGGSFRRDETWGEFRSGQPQFVQLPPSMFNQLSDGTVTLTGTVDLEIEFVALGLKKDVCSTTSPVTTTFQLVPKETQTVALVSLPEQTRDLVLDVKHLRLSAAGHTIAFQLNVQGASFDVNGGTKGLSLVGTLSLRSGNQEWPAGALVYCALVESEYQLSAEVSGFNCDHADVVFRPNADVLLRPTDGEVGFRQPFVEEIWGEEIVVKDVPVERSVK
jgi:hypothetical protein